MRALFDPFRQNPKLTQVGSSLVKQMKSSEICRRKYGDSAAKSVVMVLSASEWPDLVLEAIFSYLDLASLRAASLVCKSWYRILNDENNDVWRLHCVRRLAQEALQSSELLSSLPTYKSKLRAFCHAWNPEDCSKNIYIKSNGFTLHRFLGLVLFLAALYLPCCVF